MTLGEAFNILRDALNAALVPNDFPNVVSMTPKHPDLVESDDEFPYFCMEYSGEKPEYEGSDNRWIQPSREMSEIRVWAAIGQSEEESLSVDLMGIVQKIRDVVTSVTANTNNNFRVRVDAVETEYEPSGRWALAVATVVIGAYGN